ncbi:hypothetical protein RDV89_03020 [Nocardioides zeae]|uniref:NUDIX hydrolase n=1 Tax=Nocardioides imazamoxiresistens TaxID=3231893 RepID=A0ABU3PS14_9ACTN|nr:hypothetical protein [Nocardioides zeae]MDT9592022.1 hypothetical protein [Nocardioides zeae]
MSDQLVRSTPDAPWLPTGGRADVVASDVPPAPTCLVRLLLRTGTSVFCVPRGGGGGLDLPTRTVPPDDPDGRRTASALARDLTGDDTGLRLVGFVRNTVPGEDDPSDDGYPWPVPHAHFSVWTLDGGLGDDAPSGAWCDIGPGSSLASRHWFPLVDGQSADGSADGSAAR